MSGPSPLVPSPLVCGTESAFITDNVRVEDIKPLIPAACLLEDLPLSQSALETVKKARKAVNAVVRDGDDRLVVVVGPCSIHDPKAALEYAERLKGEIAKHEKNLVILMRTYFEKPRTTVGWKGLVNDPDLDNTYKINKGLQIGRRLLLDINEMGVPVSTEFLDTISPQYTSDLIAWGAIGARTTECQLHRELASGVSCAVGFKNGTSGDVQIATDAIKSSQHPHHFIGVTKQGLISVIKTKGNDCCHLILRGGKAPNFDAESVASASAVLEKGGLQPRIMIDCSHGNSQKKHENQPVVTANIAEQVAGGNKALRGVMIESNLVEGRQDLVAGQADKLVYGKSITDACVSWETTVEMLQTLASAVEARRAKA